MAETRYNIKDLFKENGSIDMVTEGGVNVVLTLDLLRKLIPPAFNDKNKQQPVRLPNNAELAMFANMIFEDKLNPYKRECWMYWLNGTYVPVVAAQSRMRKVMSMDDYEGFEWGFVLADGTRQVQGGKSPLPDIVGLWGQVYRKDRKPYHHELMRVDYAKGSNLTMCQKAHKDQAHRYAFADKMGNLNTENEVPMQLAGDTPEQEKPQEMGAKVVEAKEVMPVKTNSEVVADFKPEFKVKKTPVTDVIPSDFEVKTHGDGKAAPKPTVDVRPDWAK